MRLKRLPLTAAWVSVCLIALPTSGIGADSPAKLNFNRDVRPILSESCFTCHGPDTAKRKGDLRLDTGTGLFGAKEGEGVVAPGKPAESELFLRVTSKDKEEVMPPPDSGKPLSAAQIEILKRWISEGAEYQGHWAYLPPKRAAVPAVEGLPNEIDRFLRARQIEKGLKPALEADRVTLIRRLSFDLRGLPPTPAEVDAFIKDNRADAYERLVDAFLASPRYGERMAMYWLDLVRYADTNGYHSDNHRDVYLFRDYVIKSFNKNVPFDRFTIEQLAGDLLPDPTDENRIASGYNRLLLTTEEGGGQPKEYMAKYASDRVRNLGTVWLGGTYQCAECHDHKYDPMTMKDFYSLGAFFADIQETAVGKQVGTPILGAAEKAKLAGIDAEIAASRKTLDTQTPELDRSMAAWAENALRASPGSPAWTTLKSNSTKSRGGANLASQPEGTILVSGAAADRDVYMITFKSPDKPTTALRLDVLPDPSLPGKGPGRADNGNFVLNQFEVKGEKSPVSIASATASHSQSGFDVKGAIDAENRSGWAILPRTGTAEHAIFELKENLPPGQTITVTLRFNYGTRHALGKFKLSATDAPRPVRADGQTGIPANIVKILETKPESRTEADRAALAAYHRGIAPELEPARKKLAELEKSRKAVVDSAPTMLITQRGEPRMMRVLPRGNWLDESGEVVSPAFPAFLSARKPGEKRLNRLDLARWLVSGENPLVARVFVNRLWKLTFGQGLVATLDDFGAQGASPTNEELLDWLAVDFREGGWDIKSTLKRMLMSRAYRTSSVPTAEQKVIDPSNILLARQNRWRLEAEMVRDSALEISGLLVERIGGPSAKPYQPQGYWAMMNFPKREWQADHGDGLYRRGLYTYWCRTFLHPSLLAFDASTREECRVDRPKSNTPLQALVLLNDPTYVEAARTFASRILNEGGTEPSRRLDFAFRVALSRTPTDKERAILTRLQTTHRANYQMDPKAATELIRVGEKPAPAGIDAAELASWTSVARVILNLHETIARN